MCAENDRLAVVMPVYNEEEAIRGVLEKWIECLDSLQCQYRVFAFNDGSSDGSLAVLRECEARFGGRLVVVDKPNGGHGETILSGYRRVAEKGFAWVFQVDSDDEMQPDSFPELWNRRADYDFLLGRRAGRKQALSRKVISFVSRLLVRFCFGRTVWDVNAPYRLMRVACFKKWFECIPSDTFAPNVLLAGLAAADGCRRFELPVPQRDRKTGVVSIRHWKLFKAACKSFFQTFWFAKRVNGGRVGIWLSAGVTFAMATSYVLLTDYVSFATCDEIGTADTAISCARDGIWRSYVWEYSYQPLHFALKYIWVKIFGFSHLAVCSMDTVLAAVAELYVLSIAVRRRWIFTCGGCLLLTVLFWCGWRLSYMFTMGRIDFLVMISTAALVDSLLESHHRNCAWRLVWTSFFVALSAVYTAPLMLMLAVFMSVDSKRRMSVKATGCSVVSGYLMAVVVTFVFYLYHGYLLRYLYTFVVFNQNLSGSEASPFGFCARLWSAYFRIDPWATCVMLLAVGMSCLRRRLTKWHGFVLAIPFLMVLSGRYMEYYSWVFYLPAVVCLVHALEGLRSRMGVRIVLVLSVLCLPMRFLWAAAYKAEARALSTTGRWFVEKRVQELVRARNVVLTDTVAFEDGRAIENPFYYPLVNAGAIVWRRAPECFDGMLFRDKLKMILDAVDARLFPLVETFENMPTHWWPESGFAIGRIGRPADLVEKLNRHGYSASVEVEDGSFHLVRFELQSAQ